MWGLAIARSWYKWSATRKVSSSYVPHPAGHYYLELLSRIHMATGPDVHSVRKTILLMAWPVMLSNLLQSLTTTVDVFLVGQLPNGDVAVGAVGLGAQIFFLAFSVAFAIGTGTVALIARFTGAKDDAMANHTLKVSLALGLLLSVPVALLGIFGAPWLLGIFGAAPEVVSEGVAYTSTLFYSIPFLFINLLSTMAFRGRGENRTPLYVGGLVNLVNFAINYNLIYGRLGLPAMGVTGAAVGTVISYAIGAAVFAYLLFRGRSGLSFGASSGKNPLDVGLSRRILRLGTPAAAEQLLVQAGFTAWIVLVATFGTEALAAHTVGLRINLLAFMPGFGFSVASTALVGQSLGARDPNGAEKSAKESMKLSLLTMAALAVVLFVFAEQIAFLFLPDEGVVSLASQWIRIYAVGLPAFGWFFTTDGALRGAGDIIWPTATSAGGLLLVRLPLSILLGLIVFNSVLGVWLSMVIEYYVRTAVISWRFSSGAWKVARV